MTTTRKLVPGPEDFYLFLLIATIGYILIFWRN
jgi:hypothetical protein